MPLLDIKNGNLSVKKLFHVFAIPQSTEITRPNLTNPSDNKYRLEFTERINNTYLIQSGLNFN